MRKSVPLSRGPGPGRRWPLTLRAAGGLAWALVFVFANAAAQTMTGDADDPKIPAVETDGPPALYAPNPDLASDRAYTIYLSGDRVCKRCRWRFVPPDEIELTGPTGISARYPAREAIGVDRHPVWRRLVGKGIRGTGLAGRAVVPQAFDDEPGLDYP